MIIGIGVDVWSIKEMQSYLDSHAPFVRDHFTPKELNDCLAKPNPAHALAARYAAKEAAIKALGHTNMFAPKDIQGGVNYLELEMLNDPEGRPYFAFSGKFADVCQHRGVKQSFVSISHQEDMAIAFVVFQSA